MISFLRMNACDPGFPENACGVWVIVRVTDKTSTEVIAKILDGL
jgi:hypothetical protein